MIQFNMSNFFCREFEYQTIVFYPLMGLYQLLPLQVRVDLEAMAIKEYSTLPTSLG